MDQQLKQRLIGATVIVSLIVIFVPMLFDEKSEKGDGTAVESAIPPIPDDSESKEIPLPPGAGRNDAEGNTERSSASSYRIVPLSDSADSETQAPKSKADAAPEDTETSAPLEEEQPPPDGADEHQPAETRDSAGEKAAGKSAAGSNTNPPTQSASRPEAAGEQDRLRDKAKTKSAQTKRRETDARKRRAATKTAARPARKDGQKTPATLAGAPASPAPTVEAPPAPVSAWVVQTGSFTTEAKARALADKLRQAKFAAFVEPVKGKTSVIYRVHVGPELDKGRAEQLQQQLETDAKIKGIIVPRP